MSDKNEKKIHEAAKNAAIYDNIMLFDEGFKTKTGERGITLSGGQKQRVSIARAIVKEPRILIFDDALSAIDTKTEEEILKNLGQVMRNRTCVIISHRISTVKNAGRIIMLDQGQIIESGDHGELLNKKGFYYKLYQKQLMEEENMTLGGF
jgi:ATP-binding cassette subfamily B protein